MFRTENVETTDMNKSEKVNFTKTKEENLEEPAKTVTNCDDDSPDISFTGCGFLGIYQVGVSACLLAHAPHLLHQRLIGCSSGALICGALTGCVPLSAMARMVLVAAQRTADRPLGAFTPGFSLDAVLRERLEALVPEDIHLRAAGRLVVSVTKFLDGANLLLTEFASKAELLSALRASSFVPLVSGPWLPSLSGRLYMDGAISNNLAIVGPGPTITVSPFPGEATICPATPAGRPLLRVPYGPASTHRWHLLDARLVGMLVPAGLDGQAELCAEGYRDAASFLVRTGRLEEGEAVGLPEEVLQVFREAREAGQGRHSVRGGVLVQLQTIIACVFLFFFVLNSFVTRRGAGILGAGMLGGTCLAFLTAVMLS